MSQYEFCSIIFSDHQAIRHVPPRYELGASPGVHVLRAVGDAAPQPAGADAAEGQGVCADAAQRHAVYARTLCHAQGK